MAASFLSSIAISIMNHTVTNVIHHRKAYHTQQCSTSDQSGKSVSLSGDGTILAIGAPFNDSDTNGSQGNVRVYKWDDTNTIWNQLGADIDGEEAGDYSGWSVSLSSAGTILAIGAPYNDGDTGHVRVYEWDNTNTTWNKLGDDIDGEAVEDYSGYSVSLSGDGTTVAIGSPYNDGTTGDEDDNRGHVRVYEWDNTLTTPAWVQIGSDIDGAYGNQSGWSVSLSSNGNILTMGARGNVRVYKWDNTNTIWDQLGADIDGEAAGDFSGYSVSLSGDGTILAIGAPLNDGDTGDDYDDRGHVRVYKWDGSTWNQLGAAIDGKALGDNSGSSVSLSSDGTILAIGAPGDGDVSGHVRVYEWDNTSWNQIGDDIYGAAAGDKSGKSVSLSSDGTILAIGATLNDGTTGNKNDNRGHVLVYEWDGSTWTKKLYKPTIKFINCTYTQSLKNIPSHIEFIQNKIIPGTLPFAHTGPVSNSGINKIADNVYIVRK